MGRRSRRRAAGEAPPAKTPEESRSGTEESQSGAVRSEPRRSRSEAKDEAARARLEPLQPGERPRAVTVGAIVAALFAVGNVVAWFAGLEVRGERQSFFQIALLAALLLVTAWGMWRARYWAVLGMQALLGLTLLIFGVVIFVQATLLQALLILAVVILPGGALFWFLVKAMARIQMPERGR